MNLFTDYELFLMFSILGGLLLLVFIFVIVDIILNRKDKLNNDVLEKDNIVENKIDDKIDNILETKEELKDINVINNNIELDDEIEELDLNIIKIEPSSTLDSKEKAKIELLKIEEELEHEVSLEDTITNLEIIEESNAIISYQELLSNTNNLSILSDDGDEPITISEVFERFNENNKEDISSELDNISELTQGTFLPSPYISPVNGIEYESLSEIQLENTANLEKLEKEIRKTNEFLNILNELKKNLD